MNPLPITQVAFKRKPRTCPSCNSTRIADYLYGMPSSEVLEDRDAGRIVLGGCCVSNDDPKWQCTACKTDLYRFPTVHRDCWVDPEQVHRLRESVGWGSAVENRKRDLEKCYAHFSCTVAGCLTGMLFAISDGASDALLNNLTVCPDWQGRGIGKALVQTAVRELAKDGIRYFNVVFEPELEAFYRKCGLTIMRGGVVDLHEGRPEWM